MTFEPQKLFIGLMDFFSILLPGALLTYLLMGEIGPVVLRDRYAKLAGSEACAVFLFASYLFGHLVFLIGSWLDEFYDWARRYTLNNQIAMLALRGRLLPWPARALIWLVFKGERNLAVDRAGNPTHVGCVVFRKRGGKTQYLLVETTNDPIQWVLPKGHVEEAEHPRETAVREVYEETGVWARIVHDPGHVSHSVNGQVVTVGCYLMEALGSGMRNGRVRQHVWLSLPDAVSRANHLETRELLQGAEQHRVRISS